jgi:hypothetical protein
MKEDVCMSKDKTRVTIGGGLKFLITLGLIVATTLIFNPGQNETLPAAISMYVYTLLFVFLAVNGSNSRFAIWLSERKFFSNLFLVPTIACAFYSGGYFLLSDEGNPSFSAFAALLTVLSIPFSLILMRVQGGIRRENTLTAFLLFPVIIFLACYFFAATAILIAAGVSLAAVLICFIVSCIEFSRDHKVDYSSGDSTATSGDYKAYWDGHPMSDVSDNVIHIKGTIIVEYKGSLYESHANRVVEDLIQSYVYSVGSDMPGYSVDGASVSVKYVNID